MVSQERIIKKTFGDDTTYVVVPDADIDGTYGENVSGFFGYTVAGAYFESMMPYLLFDAPVSIFNVPDITAAVNAAEGK